MVALPSKTIADRFQSPPEPVLQGRWRVWKFTRADIQTLLQLGVVPEDASTELLNGMIVHKDRAATGEDPLMIGRDHKVCVERLSNLRIVLNGADRHVESQQPLFCSETHVPEPDCMVLRGTLEQYDDYPGAADAWSVVEVADSSYERDAGEKLRGYAHAGVGQYIIINLRNRTAEVYQTPDTAAGTYPAPRVIAETEDLPLRVGQEEHLPVSLRSLLP